MLKKRNSIAKALSYASLFYVTIYFILSVSLILQWMIILLFAESGVCIKAYFWDLSGNQHSLPRPNSVQQWLWRGE